MKILYRDGHLYTSIEICFRGATKIIENIVIDTGASETIISPDAVEDIGLVAEINDTVNSFYGAGGSLHNLFSKEVDEVKFGVGCFKNAKLDFGIIDPNGIINGLLGLDLLISLGAVINLKKLTVTLDSSNSISGSAVHGGS